ncbi:MAG TPA: hypothetical protein VIJ78_01405 [Pseudolabrys sp.]
MTPRRTSTKKKRSKPAGKSRARQISNWLAFIHPHLGRYVTLPSGDQKKYFERLSEEMRQLEIDEGGRRDAPGPSVNTLRRYMAAAQFLESHGIVKFPAGRPRMPAAAVEAIVRISKRDPAYAQTLLADLMAGRQTIRRLRTELEGMPEQGLAPDPNIRKFSYEELRQALSKFASGLFGKPVAPTEFQLTEFEFEPDVVPVATFDPLAQPFATGEFGDGRRVAIFDESTVRWKVSPDRARREFKRNIAVATTLFDIVAVCYTTLQSDVDDMRARMLDHCRKRVLVLTGVLASEVGEHLEPMTHFKQ